MPTPGAQAKFFRSVARALEELATAVTEDAAEEPLALDEAAPDPGMEHNLGRRQRQILELPALAHADGVKTSQIADAIQYEVPNTYTTLQALARHGIVEQVSGKEPQHWRLARRYRGNAEAFMRIASNVRKGEWTTYGDVSIAVIGHPNGARGAGRAAATAPEFPNPHRVLMEGGTINPNWRDGEGRGPAECRRRLEEDDGVPFNEEDVADPTRRVAWDELMKRDALEGL